MSLDSLYYKCSGVHLSTKVKKVSVYQHPKQKGERGGGGAVNHVFQRKGEGVWVKIRLKHWLDIYDKERRALGTRSLRLG